MAKIMTLHAIEPTPPDETASVQPVVLIVDDESLNRFLIAEALAADAYRIVEMESGEAAIDYMRHNNADLILLDIDMPGIGGLATCRTIRALPQGKLVPIAMVTGLDDNASVEQAFTCGATDFLTKPVNWTLMRQRVRFMLRHGSITQELQRNEQVLEQVHEIAGIGHWKWDIVNHVVTHSELFRRLIPGLPPVVTGVTPGSQPRSEFGQALFAAMHAAIQTQLTTFQQELAIDIPERGRRYLVNRGHIDYRDGEPVYAICTVQDVTERRRDEERFAAIFNESPVGIVEADCSTLFEVTRQPGFADATDEQIYNGITKLLSKHRQDSNLFIKANPAAQRILPQDQSHPLLQKLRTEITFHFLTALRDNRRHLMINCELPLNSDEIREVIINAHLPDNSEDYKHFVISISDVTDLNRRAAQLKRADAIIANSRDAVAVMDKDRRVLSVNPACVRMTGYTFEQLQRANHFTTLLRDPDATTPLIRAALTRQGYWRGEVELQCRDGKWIPAMMQVHIIRNERGELDGFVAITSDISHVKESERRFYQLAHFDALTNLPNRLSLQEQLLDAFERSADRAFCLLYIDLDGFKWVNDSMGHQTGDALLREVSARLSATCPTGDLLARIGGDEFALLMLNDATQSAIDTQAERIFAALEPAFDMQGRQIFIGASIGACRYPDDARNAEEMLRNADSAMYEAKRLGRGQLCYYSADLTSTSDHRLQIENELRVAIASDELFLLYQPKYNAMSGAMVGAEALVHWRNPKRGIMRPGEFISVAEASGLIIPLGEWVINEACRQLAEWRRESGHAIPLAINISALHLREQSLLQVMTDTIARCGIDPHCLEIEITEDSLDFRGGDDKPYTMLKQLSALGLSIAIDDFGTGYSSLSQLKNMPISTLKIDGSFVRDIAVSESDHAIISAIVGLAKTLEMAIVAEGVESEEQAHQLRLLNCDILQGFLYSRPLPPVELLQKFLAQLNR